MWQKRHRGIYAPSPFALDNNGTLSLATPRPLEPRAYDYTLHKADGGVEVKWGFSAETLIKMETSQAGDCVGMTADDLYLFHCHNKARFLSDKHINYIDIALSEDGQRVAAAFSDLAGASFALAYGDISGRLLWLREFDSPLTAVAISRNGKSVAAGVESGELVLLNESRRDVWTFDLDAPVRSLACSSNADRVAYALDVGIVGCIGAGARLWEGSFRGIPGAMALSEDGGVCALLAADSAEANSTVYCLLQDGSEGWQHDTERKSTGVSLSPDGRFLAIGSRDGTIAMYGIVPGEEGEGGTIEPSAAAVTGARALTESGDLAGACALLKSAAASNPTDLALYEEYIRLRTDWRARDMDAGRELLNSADARAAIRAFAAILEDDPLCQEAAAQLRSARSARSGQLILEAEELERGGDCVRAEACLREAVAVAPVELQDARHALSQFVNRRAQASDALAHQLRSAGDIHGALAALIQAQSKAPTPERSIEIRSLQTDAEFERGMIAYNAKRYLEAVFQFKKVLRLNAYHAEAQRHLDFARRFSQDSSTDSLQDRFSRLE